MFPFNRNKKTDDSFTELDEVFSRHLKSVNITPRPGFKEVLFARLQAARQAVSMSRLSFFKERLGLNSTFFRRLAPVGMTVLVIAVIATTVFQPFFGIKTVYAQDNFTLTAEQSDSLGVAPNSSFILESKEDINQSFVEENLTVNTGVDYNLEQVSKNKVRIAFSEPLPVSNVVTFSLNSEMLASANETVERPYNWAFQVKGPFRIVSTLPGDHQAHVPLDTGIEITFSYENINLDDFAQALTISPAVKGHVEQFRKTFVYVPEENLQPKTVYNVTLSGSLGLKGSQETIGTDRSFSFETDENNSVRRSYLWVDDQYIITTPSDQISVAFSAWQNNDSDERPIGVEVHKFISNDQVSDFQQYLTAFQKVRGSEWLAYTDASDYVDLNQMPVVASFEPSKIQSGWRDYLLFPAPLTRGYYVAVYTYGQQKAFSLIESSQLTAYAAKAIDQTLVWVNSAETKTALSAASVKFIGFNETVQTTDGNGLVSIPVPNGLSAEEYTQRDLLEIRSGSEAIVLSLENQSRIYNSNLMSPERTPLLSLSEQNWTYLYTDRPMYKANDTIKFWGYAENRDSGEKLKIVRVLIGENGWCSPLTCGYGEYKDIVFDEAVVDVSKQGTFTGELQLQDVPAGYYSVRVMVGEDEISNRGISVSEYVKPAFSLSIDADMDAMFAGDSVGFTVHGEFFDSTPVNGLPVIAETTDGNQQTLTLDSAGNARGNVIFPYNSDWGYPSSQWINIYPARSEEADIYTNTSVMVLGPKVTIREDWENSGIENGVGTIKVEARNVQAVNSFEVKDYAPTVKSGQLINGELYEITYNKIETGTAYDFVRKETVAQYYYERVEKKLNDFSLTTDASGQAVYTFAAGNSEANYRVVLIAKDENGRADKIDTVVYQKRDYESSEDNVLRFKNLDDDKKKQEWSEPVYQVGDAVHLQVVRSEKPFTVAGGGKFLFLQAHQGIKNFEVVDNNLYTFNFDQSLVPNLDVYGVYFDGHAYAQVNDWGWGGAGGQSVVFDETEKELKIEVVADKETYRPGDEATLNVSITDKDGNPVSAEVNLNIVDEAFYALVNDDAAPLYWLYHGVSSGILTTKVSDSIKNMDAAMAEGGGGGERGRSVFKDTADFAVVETDNEGKATYSLKLPDNLTSWRVTAQALNTQEKMAGDTKIDLKATLPFFITPTMRETYLVDDQPIVLIRSAGTKLGLSDMVEYDISIPDANVEQKEFATAAETVNFALPKLSEGQHEITIKGLVNGLTDTVTRSIKIISSNLVKPVVTTTDLGSSQNISGSADGLTMVTFLDGGAGKYYSSLNSLSGNFGDRADEIVTRVLATNILNEKFGENNQTPDLSVSTYQDNLGIRLLPYGDVDFDTSVKVAMTGGAPFDQEGLKNYFGNTLYSSRQTGQEISAEDAAKSYAALAALGEPVLAEVQRLVSDHGSELGTNEKLYLSLALHYSGDDEGSRTIYRELVKGVTKEFGYAYLPANDVETQGEQTALLGILSAALRESDREALYDYVTNQYQGNTLLVLDQVLFIKEAIKSLKDSEVKVAYTLEGERREMTLKNSETVTLALSPGELMTLNPAVEKGSAVAVSKYETPLVNDNSIVDEKLGLTRTYSVVDGQPGQVIKAGDLVKVEVQFEVPIVKNLLSPINNQDTQSDSLVTGWDVPIKEDIVTEPDKNVSETFEITDVLPSGLALVTPIGSWLWQEKCMSYPSAAESQRVTFYVNNNEDFGEKGLCQPYTLTYFARVVTPGTYVSEPAYIRSVRDPNDNNHSAETIITINE